MFKSKRIRSKSSRKPIDGLNRRSTLEALENRSLMAGDVAATLISNTLFVNEGANALNSSNQVQVSQLANGKIRVAGYTNNGNPSLINGQAFVDFAVPGGPTNTNLVVNLRGGSDRIALWNASLNSVSINTSSAGAGVTDIDTVDIQNLKSNGTVKIETGDGVDNVFLQNFQIGGGPVSDLLIDTGSGGDVVKVGNTSSWSDVVGNMRIKTYLSLSESDVDNVSVQLTTVHKSGDIDVGGGDDKIEMLADTFGDDLLIFAGTGNDTVQIREVQIIDDFFASMGQGNDTLDLNYVRADEMSLNGDDGFDTLIKSYDTHSRLLSQSGWSRINGRLTGLTTTTGSNASNLQVRA